MPTTPRDRKKSQEYWTSRHKTGVSSRNHPEARDLRICQRGSGYRQAPSNLRFPKSHGCPLLATAAATCPEFRDALSLGILLLTRSVPRESGCYPTPIPSTVRGNEAVGSSRRGERGRLLLRKTYRLLSQPWKATPISLQMGHKQPHRL